VEWLPWNASAFDRARAERKTVLLSVVTRWSESCREMDRTTFGNSNIIARVNERFVPIRVDADRRPDISARYDLGGWPTTAFLTADGDVIGGGTFVSHDRMPAILDRVIDAVESGRVDRAAPQDMSESSAPRSSSRSDLVAVVFNSFDATCGGFGVEPKFPLTAPLELALSSYRAAQDPATARMIETTLDAMGWSELYDEVDGGFFRYADARDWRRPHREKLLEVNAALIKVYLDASETLAVARYRERAVDVLRYIQTWLADPVDGGWAGSQAEDSAYYGTDASMRAGHPPPVVDSTLYASANAAMVSCGLRAGELLDDTALGEFAIKSLERLVVACYSPGAGIAHYLDVRPFVRGLLDDQVSMAAANLDAHASTGNVVYQMMAQELLHYAVRTMWDDAEGGFFDRSIVDDAERIGRMRDRLKPFVANCEAARVLKRLAATPGDHDFGQRAEATLAAMAPLAAQQGPLAAHYLLAVNSGA
jgi:uncharacterized protein YyaL (SSP411 family)